MAFFGSDWKDDVKGDDGPMVPSSWKDQSDDVFPIPEPSVYQLLDRMTDVERLEVFHHYCKHCGSKDKNCNCWKDE